jgi:hypothetical protein
VFSSDIKKQLAFQAVMTNQKETLELMTWGCPALFDLFLTLFLWQNKRPQPGAVIPPGFKEDIKK